jgi:SAM-dependent methyltransferase
MGTDPEVEAWFRELDHPLKDAMLEVRKAILKTDPRVTEGMKWKSPTFMFEGNIASIDPKAKRHVSLLFHQGATIPGKHPALEGGGTTARYMRFADAGEVAAMKADLEAAVRAWIDMKSGLPMAMADREAWLREIRRQNEAQEDALAPVYDESWGEIESTHRAFIERFLDRLPPGGRVLDAACGTGKYFGMMLDSGRSVLGVDHSGAYLARAVEKHPAASVAKHDLQDLPFQDEFDGVMCVDAMEFVPPEDWPAVLDRFRQALRPRGWLYLTVELAPEPKLRAATEEAQASGLPVVEGEAFWKEPDEPQGYYHYHPSLDRVSAWIAAARFQIVEEAEGPWEDDDYAYHHVVARAADLRG